MEADRPANWGDHFTMILVVFLAMRFRARQKDFSSSDSVTGGPNKGQIVVYILIRHAIHWVWSLPVPVTSPLSIHDAESAIRKGGQVERLFGSQL